MSFTRIQVTGQYKRADGTAAQGFVTFTPTAEMANGTVLPLATVSSELDDLGRLTDANGDLFITLDATDDPGTKPQNQGYIVQEFIGAEPHTFVALIPSGAAGGTIDMSALVPAAQMTTYYDYTVVYDSTFETAVRDNTLDQFDAPVATMDGGSQRWVNLGTPEFLTDFGSAYHSLIGRTYYEPTTLQQKVTTSSALTPIDTSNLVLTFVALSTDVIVELEATAGFNTGFGSYGWALVDSGGTQWGNWVQVLDTSAANALSSVRRAAIHVTGLTQGNTYHFRWAHAVAGGTSPSGGIFIVGKQANTFTGAELGPAMMRALAFL